MQTMGAARPGETVRVLRVGGAGPVKRRIMEMGITKGVEVRVRNGSSNACPRKAEAFPGGPDAR